MTNWTTVFRYELKRNFRRKAYLFSTFGIPVIGILMIMGYLFISRTATSSPQNGDKPLAIGDFRPIGYVDSTAYFGVPADDPDNPLAEMITAYSTFDDGKQALIAGKIDALYLIPEDYFEDGKVVLWVRDFNLESFNSVLMETYLLQKLKQDTPDEVILRLRTPITSIEEQRIQRGNATIEENARDKDFLVVYAFAMALMVSTFTASGYLMQSVVEEKESKTVEIILTSVKPFPLLLGKILAMGLLGLCQIMVWGGAMVFLLQLTSVEIFDVGQIDLKPMALILTVLYFILGFIFTGSVFAAVGALVNSTRDGSQIAGWLVFPTLIPLFFTATFAEEPNGTLATLFSVIPFTAPMTMVMRMSITDVPAYQIFLSMGVVVLTALLGIWIAGRAFRAGTLLQGTSFSIRNISQLFRVRGYKTVFL